VYSFFGGEPRANPASGVEGCHVRIAGLVTVITTSPAIQTPIIERFPVAPAVHV
jgi:hypothetical protein